MAKKDDKQREIEQRTGRPAPERSHDRADRARSRRPTRWRSKAAKSQWQERNAPAASDPVSQAELDGLSLLGGSDPRGDGALGGVSDPVRDGSAGPRERAGEEVKLSGAGGRKNPPLMEDAGTGDGGSASRAGVAGGARGHGGTSDSGAGGPMGDTAGGPASSTRRAGSTWGNRTPTSATTIGTGIAEHGTPRAPHLSARPRPFPTFPTFPTFPPGPLSDGPRRLIFDLDGTLLDTNAAHVQSWVRAFERHGYKVLADRIGPEIGKGGDNLVPAILGDEAEERDGEALRASPWRSSCASPSASASGCSTAWRRCSTPSGSAGSGSRSPPRRPTRTSRPCSRAWASTSDRASDAVVSKSDVEESKPAPTWCSPRIGKLALSPAQCAMVGDTPFDALSAKRAGVVTLGLLSGRLHAEPLLRSAGARPRLARPGHLLAELDKALDLASPGRLAAPRSSPSG
jgi:phosphoglycolate phosphatase-like HAD superfamily hydrolase